MQRSAASSQLKRASVPSIRKLPLLSVRQSPPTSVAAQYPGAALSSQSSAARVTGTAPRSEEAAIKSFSKKFKDKTKNTWVTGAPASAFVKHEGKYQTRCNLKEYKYKNRSKSGK